MDQRRAAGALLALAACIATATTAPTASGNHTALDLYGGNTEGCYYNFRHYAEGDRIMTNEPCLNCTCHNRMLMCYLRVCPFTKAIGQDCTVEKRADQCCPIVTCPDVPVDLLTSTSTSSPAEYGSTGVGKLDNYGCTINGKYLPEGAKVPQSPGKPCEHCYCIRNMTTCVMQECTLHVDGCTPIYAKDVCCPIRYFCDHPDEEMPELDDMSTTVRPTPGFLLTTVTTEEPTTLPAKRDCIEDNQIYPDGALIKTEKPCEHCYCMKGDIVCVVQECGTPMENEGKNCTSLPPREGQCCPDTYICEGDEVITEKQSDEITTIPPRRSGVEGSGYRHDDDLPYTDTMSPNEIEGSGEEETTSGIPSEILVSEPETTEANILQSLSTASTPVSQDIDQETTEPDKGLNTVPSDEEMTESSYVAKTTSSDDTKVTELPSVLNQGKDETTESSIEEKTTSHDVKITEPILTQDTVPSDNKEESSESPFQGTTVQFKEESIKPSIESETVSSESPETVTVEPSIEVEATKQPAIEHMDEVKTEPSVVDVKDSTLKDDVTEESSQPIFEEEPKTTELPIRKETESSEISKMTTTPVTVLREGTTEPIVTAEKTTEAIKEIEESPEPGATDAPGVQDITPSKVSDESTESSVIVETTPSEESKVTQSSTDTEQHPEKPLTTTIKEDTATTETILRRTDAITTEITPLKETQQPDVITSKYEPSSAETIAPTMDYEFDSTPGPQKPEEPITDSIMELSTFAHVADKESPTVYVTQKLDVSEITTQNPEENEIGEELPHLSSPDQIPGEGNCLLNGITYGNNSVVPSTNKCDSTCKCFSSIIKCDPIMCGPQPDYMDNCQVTYDTPDSCCPTYVCDHSKETIPPQPHSQMSVTESPTIATGIECQGDECEVTGEKKPPSALSPTPETCGSEGCTAVEQSAPTPTDIEPEKCTGDNCVSPTTSPTKEEPQSCESPDQCKEDIVPEQQGTPCDGESCVVDKEQTQPCEGESCASKPGEVVPQVCDNEEECKQSKVPGSEKLPESPVVPCDGENCQSKPVEVVPQVCDNEEECKQSKVPGSEKRPESPIVPCDGESCVVDKEQSQPCEGESCASKPGEVVPQVCDNEEECKQSKVPGSEKLPESPVVPCDGENCQSKPVEVVPQVCINEEECKQSKVPESERPPCEGEKCILENKFCTEESGCDQPQQTPCEGEHCEQKPEVLKDENLPATPVPICEGDLCVPSSGDCADGKCAGVTEQPQSSEQGDVCSEESGCKKPADETCHDESCKEQGPASGQLPTECDGPDCVQLEPAVPSEGTTTEFDKEPAIEHDHKVTTELPVPAVKVTETPEGNEITPGPEELTTSISKVSDLTTEQSQPQTPEEEEKLPEPTTEASGMVPEISEIPTEMHPEPSATNAPEKDGDVFAFTPPAPDSDEIQTELPDTAKDEISQEQVTQAPVDKITTDLPESSMTNAVDDDTRRHEEPKPTVTSVSVDDQPRTELSEKAQDETATVLPESLGASASQDETSTESEYSATSVSQDGIPTESVSPATSAPKDETPTELPPSVSIMPHDEAHTELPESPVTNIPQDGFRTELPEPVHEKQPADETVTELSKPILETQHDVDEEIQTELPESPVTQAQEEPRTELPESPITKVPQDESRTEISGQEYDVTPTELPDLVITTAPQGETHTQLPESSETHKPQEDTELPQLPETSEPQEDKETATGTPEDKTELPISVVTSAPFDKTQTELPESPITSKPQGTELPESPTTNDAGDEFEFLHTIMPEDTLDTVTPALEDEILTKPPESLKPTKLHDEQPTTLEPKPNAPEDELHTESPESPITNAVEEKKQTAAPEIFVSQAETSPGLPESPITSPAHDVTTEVVVKSTDSDKGGMSATYDVTTVHELSMGIDKEELPTQATILPEVEEPVTVGEEQHLQPEFPGEHTSQVPEELKPEKDVDTTTQSEISSMPEAEEKASTESPKPYVTLAPEQETRPTEQVPEQPDEDKQTKEPFLPLADDGYLTSIPTDEDKIRPESPLSLVTEQQPDTTTFAPHISDHKATHPPEQVVTKEDQEKPGKPEMPVTHEVTEQSITKKPDGMQPEVLVTAVITESPPRQQEEATEKESITKETPVVDEEPYTVTPLSSVTMKVEPEKEGTPEMGSVPLDTDGPYVPTVPSIQSEDVTTKNVEVSSLTEAPEKGQTVVPEVISLQTETITMVPVSADEITLTSTEEASGASNVPSLENATEAHTLDQENETESPKTSAPETLTEGPEQMTNVNVYEDITTKATKLEEPMETQTPEEQTELYPAGTADLPEVEVEHPEQQPTKESEQQSTKEPEPVMTEQSIIPSKVHNMTIVLHEEGSTEVPTYTITNLPEYSQVYVIDDDDATRRDDEPKPTIMVIETTEPTPVEETVSPVEISTKLPIPESPELPEQPQTTSPEQEFSKTTQYLVELEEHTHKMEAESTTVPSEEPTTARTELHGIQELEIGKEPSPTEEIQTETPVQATEVPTLEDTALTPSESAKPEETPEKATSTSEAIEETTSSLIDKFGSEEAQLTTRTQEKEQSTPVTPTETEKPVDTSVPVKDIIVGVQVTAPDGEFIPASTKATTSKVEIEPTTQTTILDKFTKPDEKLGEAATPEPGSSSESQSVDEVPSQEEDTHFPPSGGYGGQEPDYGEEDQAFGPGTCRYGGKVYVSAQQIPRDDPCDFCFCFRSDIICLQQSCPPPIHGCHEEPIQGFCCPRYECPVAMATTLNVTTTTTTTTTTLPPHFLPHAYNGAAQRRGCQIKGHTYKVGEVVRSSSGPCLHCTCGGDGQMKCDPKACTPEPMLRQMIAAAVSAKRRR